MDGMVFNIQRFCTNDGPGIRTVVFMKGCLLRCIWCHNPESQGFDSELMFYRHKCTGCGRCVGKVESDLDFVCYHKAKEWCGKPMSAEKVLEEVLRDRLYYENSGGGVTLSGGEPLAQFEYALEILRRAKEAGIHTAVETCGFVAGEMLERVAEFVDLFLYDIKETDPILHEKYTGASNELILQNLDLLDRLSKEVVLRCPIVPGCNDREEHYRKIAELANSHSNVIRIEVEPYHQLGEEKYVALGREKPCFAVFSDEQVEKIIEQIQQFTKVPVGKG